MGCKRKHCYMCWEEYTRGLWLTGHVFYNSGFSRDSYGGAV